MRCKHCGRETDKSHPFYIKLKGRGVDAEETKGFYCPGCYKRCVQPIIESVLNKMFSNDKETEELVRRLAHDNTRKKHAVRS